jgi:hypothetical protein
VRVILAFVLLAAADPPEVVLRVEGLTCPAVEGLG